MAPTGACHGVLRHDELPVAVGRLPRLRINGVHAGDGEDVAFLERQLALPAASMSISVSPLAGAPAMRFALAPLARVPVVWRCICWS